MEFQNKKILVALLVILFSLSSEAQVAPNLTFTDLDGMTHTIHDYTEAGYKVLLDFSYETCNPCKEWAINVGHDLWQNHGPDGDNTLRMFHIDPKPGTDQDVANYTQTWGVEYPVVNMQSVPSEYPLDSYPRLFFICADKSYYESGGYGYPSSIMKAQYFLEICNGSNLTGNKTFISATPATSSTLCNSSPFSYTPQIHVFNNDVVGIGSGAPQFEDPYDVKIFINGSHHSTQTVDPWADMSVSNFDDISYLQPIPVSQNDLLALVIDVEGDNFPDDDTIYVQIPSSVSTPTSASTSLIVEAGSIYDVYDSSNEKVHDGYGNGSFTLPEGSCYSIEFWNAQYYSGVLKDGASGSTLIQFQPGDFEGSVSPRLYFNVVTIPTPISVQEDHLNAKVMDTYFLNLLGKRLSTNNIEDLPKGVYLQLTKYENGEVRAKKVTQNHR
ncbi:MAG: hypothetical protein ISP71_05465 [Flavobacteriales bacterium]|nr:hypothetical protein [Flavobacteriales bacterium]